MLDSITKKRIDDCRDILVGKVPDPKSQIEQITIALIYKFMDDMDMEAVELGGVREFFSGDYERFAWRNLFHSSLSGIDRVKLYDEAVERMETNPYIPPLFRNIFKNAYLPYRDPETLRDFLKYINDFTYDHSEKLGDAFEYLLSILGSQGDAGQFRTPRHIIDFMASMMEPTKTETILDPACGTAGFLISAFKHILKANSGNFDPETDKHAFEQHGVKLDELTVNGKHYKGDLLTPDERNRMTNQIKGYDISPDMVRLSLVNLYFHGFKEPHIYEYDTLTSEDRWNEYYDVILANPPFMSPKGGIRPHKLFSVQSKRSEVLFVDYMAEHLTAKGRAAIIVPEGIIFQSGTAYKSLRKMLVDEHFLVGVISLPAGMFNPYSGVKTSILWLDKTLARKTNNILFVKIENDGFDLGAQRRPIKQNDLPEAFKKITAYKNALRKGEPIDFDDDSMVSVVSKKEIGSNGEYNLGGERYKQPALKQSTYNVVKIGEVFKTSSGGTPSKSNEKYWNNGTIPWLKSGEVAQGFIYKSEESITGLALQESSAKIFPVNSVLIAMYGATAGQVGLLKIQSSTNQAVCAIYPNENTIPEYLYYLLKVKRDYLVGLSVGGAQPNISQTIIKELKIPLPPLSIQEEIVAEIESYQQIIDGARQVVNNYKPRIDIDPDWEMVELGEVCGIKRGRFTHRPRNAPQFYGGEYPFIQTGDVVKSHGGRVPFTQTLNKLGLEVSKLFKPTIVLITIAANIGDTGILDYEACFTDSVVGLIPNEKVNPYYLELIMRTQKQRLNDIAPQAAQKNINVAILNEVIIPIAPIETQLIIVERIKKEQELVNANNHLIELFEQRIKDRMSKVWGE
jgi:type I restriction enzyme M protein